MKKAIIYIHGKNGSADEALHYSKFFPEDKVIGFDYKANTPWEAMEEFQLFFENVRKEYPNIILIANSIGAYFAINSLENVQIEKAYFVSPIVNMEHLIMSMMQWAGVDESQLKDRKNIETSFGETLSIEYLDWVRNHPVSWNIPTSILYGSNDDLQTLVDIQQFSKEDNVELSVMDNGEHWFHTEEQMDFLDKWIYRNLNL